MSKENKQTKAKGNNKVVRKSKETFSELKKVSWPSFGKVVKQTLVVLGIVLFFTLFLLGIDRLLSWLFSLLVG